MTREQAKFELLNREPDFLPVAKQKANGHLTYVCPVCENGTGKDGDGIALNVNSKSEFPHWHCFQCGLEGDLLELWMKHNKISDYAEAFRTAYEHYHIDIDPTFSSDAMEWDSEIATGAHSKPVQPRQPVNDKTTTPQTQGARNAFDGLSEYDAHPEKFSQNSGLPNRQEAEGQNDYSNFFLQANKNLSMTDYHRGISLDTLNRFCVGFVPDWQSPKALKGGKNPPKSSRLIIPTSPYSYIARDTRPEAPKKFAKMKEGAVHIFNIEALVHF